MIARRETLKGVRLCRLPCGKPLAYRSIATACSLEGGPHAFSYDATPGKPQAFRKGGGKATNNKLPANTLLQVRSNILNKRSCRSFVFRLCDNPDDWFSVRGPDQEPAMR